MRTADLTWVEGMQFVLEAGSGHALVVDSSEESGGRNTGLRPMELLLMGVLSCTAMDVISVLKKKKQPVRDLKISARGEQADEPPQRFTQIHLEYVAYGDVDEAALARAISLSEEKYCSAIATLREGSEFSSSYRIERA